MISDRLQRSLRLVLLLRQSDGLSLRDIAHWLDCSQRTVYRDLHLLKESGFDVAWSAGGYRIETGEDLPQAELNDDELLALLATLRASPLVRNQVTRSHLQRALQKLLASCAPATRARWFRLSRNLATQPVASPPS